MILLYLAFGSTFFCTFKAQQPQACLLRCKDDYMYDMQSLLAPEVAEWSVNSVTPLQSLFHKTSQSSIYERLESACTAHTKFIECLQQCHTSRARSIIELGQNGWNVICNSFKDDRDFQSKIVPCWTNHGEYISTQCHFHALMLQASVSDFIENGWNRDGFNFDEVCRTLSLYDKCYITQTDRVCGKEGWEFILKLNTKNSHALIKLLAEIIDLKQLPSTCDQWQYPEDYSKWHIHKIEAQLRNSTSSLKFSFKLYILLTLYFIGNK